MSQSNEQDFYTRYLNPAAGGEREQPESVDPVLLPDRGPAGEDDPAGGERPQAAAGHARNGRHAPEDDPEDDPPVSAPPAQHYPPPDPPGRQPPPLPDRDEHFPPSQHRDHDQDQDQDRHREYPPMDRWAAPQHDPRYPSPPADRWGAAPQPPRPYPPPPTDRWGEEPPPYFPPRQSPPAATAPPRGGTPAEGPDPDAGRHRSQPTASVGPMRAQVRQADLVRPYKPIPEIGWRKKLHQLTRINPGVGPAEREWIDLKRRLGVNLRGTYLVAIMQQKGGASKTTSTIGLGEALARYRDDKVVAIDANPANGNLASRVDEPSTGTWRSLIADPHLVSYSDFRHYLGKDSSSGLEVLGSDGGDDVMTGMNLIQAWDKLSRQYPIGLIDCGNQMRDDLTAAILSRVDAVVVVSTTRFDGAVGAQDTLNWLISHGYPHLVRSAVMIISNVNKVAADKAVRNLHEDFERVCRAVHDIPYDPHLSDATAINFDRLAPATRRAFLEAAASVVDGFAGAADKDSGYRRTRSDQRGEWR